MMVRQIDRIRAQAKLVVEPIAYERQPHSPLLLLVRSTTLDRHPSHEAGRISVAGAPLFYECDA
jgi:hypothetical protein